MRSSRPDFGAPVVHRHPLVRLMGTVARLPKYMNLAQALIRDPSVSAPRRLAIGLGFGYAISPVDLIPGFIPIIGQLDDLAALLLGLRTALAGCTEDAAEAHLTRVGLSATALDADVRILAIASLWVVSKTAAVGAGAVRLPARWLARAARAAWPKMDAVRSSAPLD